MLLKVCNGDRLRACSSKILSSPILRRQVVSFEYEADLPPVISKTICHLDEGAPGGPYQGKLFHRLQHSHRHLNLHLQQRL